MERIDELNDLLHLAMDGIARVQHLPKLADAVAHVTEKLGDPLHEEDERHRQNVLRLAEKAKREVERGFPLLHSYTIVGSWTVLEVAVEDFLVAWLQHDRAALQCEQLAKIKLPLSQFLVLDEEERLRFLITELQHRIGSAYARGIERFEPALNVFGFGGPLEDDYARIIFELGEIRNAIVHRGGVADRKLVEACPGLNLKVGDPVVVTHEMYARFLQAIDSYLAAVLGRVHARFAELGSQDSPAGAKNANDAPRTPVAPPERE